MIDHSADAAITANINARSGYQGPVVAMLVAHIHQAIEDADRIGRGRRLAGEVYYRRIPGSQLDAALSAEADALRAWMASSEPYGLEWTCAAIETLTGTRCRHGPFTALIEKLLSGQASDKVRMRRWIGQGSMQKRAA